MIYTEQDTSLRTAPRDVLALRPIGCAVVLSASEEYTEFLNTFPRVLLTIPCKRDPIAAGQFCASNKTVSFEWMTVVCHDTLTKWHRMNKYSQPYLLYPLGTDSGTSSGGRGEREKTKGKSVKVIFTVRSSILLPLISVCLHHN